MKTLFALALFPALVFAQSMRVIDTLPTPCGSAGQQLQLKTGAGSSATYLQVTCQGDGTWKVEATLDQAVNLPLAQADITGLPAALTAASNHAASTSNPHSTTAAQVGAAVPADVAAAQAAAIAAIPAFGTSSANVPRGNDSRFSSAFNLYTSKLTAGAACDITTGVKVGGGPCIDNGTAAINAAIAAATRPLILNIDNKIGITGIMLGATGQIAVRCSPGSGVFVVNSSNSGAFAMDHSTNRVMDGATVPGTQGTDFEFSGCYVHGNRNSTQLNSSPNYPNTNSTGSDPHGNASGDSAGLPYPWLFGLHVTNMQNVLIANNTFNDIPAYAMAFDNVQHAAVLNNRVLTKSFIYNQDPVHLNGYTSDFEIRGNYSDQGDDAVALNAPEGYSGTGAGSGISDIRISNENWFNSWNGIRIYAGSNKQINNVVLNNITGHAHNAFMKLGGEGGYLFVNGQLGVINVSNVIFQADAFPFMLMESAKQLNLNGVTFLPSSSSWLFDAENSSSNIQKLNITALDPGTITAIAGSSQGTYIGSPISSLQSIVGSGVANTGLTFPDTLMGSNTTFLSDGSSACGVGALCWRNNSVSQQLLPSAALPGPIQKWLMNEGTGTTFADSSGHANTLTATSVTFTSQTGVPGLTPTFSGSSSAIAANGTYTAPTFAGSTPFTLSFWGKRTNSGSLQVIMGNQNGPGFYVAKQSDERIYVQLADTSGGLINKKFSYAMTSGTPDNIVVSYDGSKSAVGMKLYANGSLVATDTVFSDTLTGSSSTANPWNIGNIFSGSFSFAGAIADTRIWNRLLSTAEISALYAAGAQ